MAKKYIVGQDRNPERNVVSHLYHGTFDNPGLPMCQRGWNRGEDGYSIWRGNVGEKGVCATSRR